MGVLLFLATSATAAIILRVINDLRQPKCKPKYGVKNRVIIVTGANSGIGYETAKYLYQEGAKVIMACRDEGRAQKAIEKIKIKSKTNSNNGESIFMKLDLNDFESVHEFVHQIEKDDLPLFGLVNNAGVFQTSLHFNKYGFEQNFMINHLGHQLLSDLLLTRLANNGTELSPSKIVYVNSILYVKGKIEDDYFKPFNNMTPEQFAKTNMYANSKLAQLLFARELAREIDYNKFPVYVNVASPGFVATNLSRNTSHRWLKLILCAPALFFFLRTPRQGAQTILQCVMANNQSTNGFWFRKCQPAAYREIANDVNLITKVYKLTREAIGIQE